MRAVFLGNSGCGGIAEVLDTGATATLVCFRRPQNHNRPLEKNGRQEVSTYPSSARFRSGVGRLGEVRHAAGIPVGIAGRKGKFTAFMPDPNIPALLLKGAMEAPGGQLDFPRDVLELRRQVVASHLRSEYPERYRFRERRTEESARPRSLGLLF